MIPEMFFKFMMQKAWDVVLLSITLAIITFCFWAFVDAIQPYQAAQQAMLK